MNKLASLAQVIGVVVAIGTMAGCASTTVGTGRARAHTASSCRGSDGVTSECGDRGFAVERQVHDDVRVFNR